MPRPSTREDLIDAARTGYSSVTEFIAALTPEQRQAGFVFEDRDRNIRDVVAHLVAWHQMMSRWYTEGMAGRKTSMPAEGHTWRTTPALNHEIWVGAQGKTLEQSLADFHVSHSQMMTLIEAHSNDELFTAKRYRWTGSTSLGSYLVSATSSHYDWAVKKLRKAKRTWQKA